MRQHAIPCYDTRTHNGFLRHIVVREGRATGELLVALITAAGPFPQGHDLAQRLRQEVPGLTGLLWAVNASKSDAVDADAVYVLHGRPFIYERLGGLTFKLGLLTFFQTNTVQAERMLEVVREFAGLRGTEHVADLYCQTLVRSSTTRTTAFVNGRFSGALKCRVAIVESAFKEDRKLSS